MRPIIDLPGDQVGALDAWCRREGISSAEAGRFDTCILTDDLKGVEAAKTELGRRHRPSFWRNAGRQPCARWTARPAGPYRSGR
jgi:hypothetical protein